MKTPKQLIIETLELNGTIEDKHLGMTMKIKDVIKCIESDRKQLNLYSVSNSLPSWYKKLDLLGMQLEALQEDIPKNLKLRSNAKLDLELIDMKLTAMRSKLKQAFEELKGNDY